VIPFERDPGHHRDPNRRADDGFDSRRFRRGGADDALRNSQRDDSGMSGSTPARDGSSRASARTASNRAASMRDMGSIGGWLVAPLLLAATSASILLVLRGPDELFGVAFGLVLALGLAWILVSSLFPGKADRVCPECGRETLARLDPRSTHGLRCRSCGWRDESASSFLLAEDDGAPLEDIVLRERRTKRRW
jgi:hypothetical protein